MLTMAASIAWMLPERAWPFSCENIAQLMVMSNKKELRDACSQLEALFPNGNFQKDVRAFVVYCLALKFESQVHYLALRRPSGWAPRIEIYGADHIDDALAGGRGCILWGSLTTFANLALKMGYSQAGYRAIHLSRPGHGFGSSKFAIRHLNHWIIDIESCYLQSRAVIKDGNSREALNELRCALLANQVVSITASHTGKKTVETEFLGANLRIATGAVKLAVDSNSPLLPTFAIRRSDGAFAVFIEKPLPLRSGDNPYQSAVDGYAQLMENYVTNYPEQWYSLFLGRSQNMVN
jgi:lauroyl/myristoyl acyltransferase